MKEYNQLRDIAAGLIIFLGHGGRTCYPGHDVLYAGQGNKEHLSQEEVDLLRSYGWFINSEFCRGCGTDNEELRLKHGIDEESNSEEIAYKYHLPTCNEWSIFI